MPDLHTFFFSPKKMGFHFLCAIGVFVIICVIAISILNSYTRHGSEMMIPDYTGMDSQEVLNKENDYEIQISDYIYDRGQTPETVLKQDPHPGEMVKKGRKVYLTVASGEPPKVKMPQLQDVSLRQAEIMLKAVGLELGPAIYKPSQYENAVLEQLYKGREIAPGTEISAGETITLIVGKSTDDLPEEVVSD
jgi:beta-lactam-binding protein with PASTA domain